MGVTRRVVLILALFLTLSIVPKSNVQAETTATFELKNGDVFENVPYRIDQTYGIVELTLPERLLKVSIADIAEIRDATGQDITREIIGRESSKQKSPLPPVDRSQQVAPASPAPQPVTRTTQQEQWESEGSDKYRRLNRSPWVMAAKFGPLYSIPIGNFYKGFSPAVGFDGTLFFAVSRRIALGGQVVVAGVDVNEKELLEVVGLPGAVVVYSDLNPSVISFSAQVMFHSTLSHERPDRGFWYLTTGLGATKHSSTGILAATYLGDLYGVGAAKTTKFMLPTSFGVLYLFSRYVGLDAGATLEYIFVGSGENAGSPQVAALLHLRAGFSFVVPSSNKN